jgi:hypothetical protein
VQLVFLIVTTSAVAGEDPAGVTVIILSLPVATYANQTSFPGAPVSQASVALSVVAVAFVEMMQVLPEEGIVITSAELHASFNGCAIAIVFTKMNDNRTKKRGMNLFADINNLLFKT